jgi:hypothetical protein
MGVNQIKVSCGKLLLLIKGFCILKDPVCEKRVHITPSPSAPPLPASLQSLPQGLSSLGLSGGLLSSLLWSYFHPTCLDTLPHAHTTTYLSRAAEVSPGFLTPFLSLQGRDLEELEARGSYSGPRAWGYPPPWARRRMDVDLTSRPWPGHSSSSTEPRQALGPGFGSGEAATD